jgi:hypothetical protein
VIRIDDKVKCVFHSNGTQKSEITIKDLPNRSIYLKIIDNVIKEIRKSMYYIPEMSEFLRISYFQALTWPTSGGSSVGIVRLRTKHTEFSFLVY